MQHGDNALWCQAKHGFQAWRFGTLLNPMPSFVTYRLMTALFCRDVDSSRAQMDFDVGRSALPPGVISLDIRVVFIRLVLDMSNTASYAVIVLVNFDAG